MNSNISYVIFTYNEEKRISYIVKNFIKYGPVYILDGGSTDKTQEIAERMGATFYRRPITEKVQAETPEVFDFIKSIIHTDWIYWGYADNIAPKSLLEKFSEIAAENKYKMVLVPLFTYLWGDTKKYALKSHGQFLMHKDFVSFQNGHIHGMGDFTGTPEQLLKLPLKEKYALRHFSTYNMNKFVLGHLRYAEAEAIEKFQHGKRFKLSRMLAGMLRYCWIYGRYCWNNGTIGVIIVLHYVFFRLMAYTKLYEIEHGITLDSIEDNYGKAKEKLLEDF